MISRNSSCVFFFVPSFYLFSLVRFTCLKQLHPYLSLFLCSATTYQATPILRNGLFDLLFQILVHLLFCSTSLFISLITSDPTKRYLVFCVMASLTFCFEVLAFFFCSTYLSISLVNVRHAYICSLKIHG